MATKIDPSVPSSAHRAMSPQWDKVNALCGGTDAMRAAGTAYLPKWGEELPDQYKGRISRSFLYEFFKHVSDKMASKPFSQPLEWDAEDESLREVMYEDVDLQGNNLDVFAYRLLKTALRKGMVGVLVDWSGTSEEKTLADRRENHSRPFFRQLQPDTVLECKCVRRGDEDVVLRLRVTGIETMQDPDNPFDEILFETVTVWTPETITEYRRQVPKSNTKTRDPWVRASEVPNALGKVYFHTFYADRTGHMTSDLPLSGVIDKSIEHWQSASNQRVALDVARFPMLGAKGVTEAEINKVALGPLAVLATSNPQSEFYYVENEGKALEAGRKDLEDLKTEMADMVSDLYAVSSASSRASAAEAGNKAAESASVIKSICLAFSDFLESIMYSAAELQESPDPEAVVGEININDDYSMDANMAKEMEALSSARLRGDLSQQEWVREMQRRRTLDPNEEFKGGEPPLPATASAAPKPPEPVAPDEEPPEGAGGSE